jgi:hypothetical protein
VFNGDTVQAYLLPTDLVTYSSKGGSKRVVLCVAMYMTPVETAPPG